MINLQGSWTKTLNPWICSQTLRQLRQQAPLDEAHMGTVMKFEPQHDKTNKMTVRPAKTRISLGINLVWSAFTERSVGS